MLLVQPGDKNIVQLKLSVVDLDFPFAVQLNTNRVVFSINLSVSVSSDSLS